jgi:glycosyltransferase involved in cell wall biosynthesis
LKIAFVSPFAQHAGSERYLGLVLDGLPRTWIRNVVFLQDGPFVQAVRDRGLPVTLIETSAQLPGILGSARRLRRLLDGDPPDLVHANGVKAALVAVLATIGRRTPVVWVKHDLSFDRSLARPIAWRSRLVVGVSQAATRVFRGRLRRKVRVVPNALPAVEVDRAAERRRVLEALGITDDTKIVVLAGRLYAMKGQHELLEVLPELARRVPSVKVAFAGADDPNVPEYAAGLRARTAELGLGGIVEFLGPVPDAARFLAGCDVVAIPSVPAERGNTESFSLVALEAMGVGTPVAGYAEGGLPEVLGDCALLVPTGDREGLLDAILRLLGDDELRASLAACGQQRARERFGLDRMIASLEDCYREAVSPQARGT